MMMPAWRRAAVLSLALMACGTHEEPEGAIRLTRLAEVGGRRDTLSQLPRISARLANGDFYTTSFGGMSGEVPRRYGPDGQLLALIGREGAGPGEYRAPVSMMVSTDTVFIFDMSLRRVSALYRDSLIRSFHLSRPFFMGLELGDGSFVISGSGSGSGTALARIDRSGNILATFGSLTDDDLGLRWLARAPDGSFWSVGRSRSCGAQHWSANLELLEEREFCRDWFTPRHGPILISPDSPPPDAIYGLWVDSTGLWILRQTADSQYAEALGEPYPCGEGGGTCYRIGDPERAYDMRLDVYDLATGEPFASKRTDWGFGWVTEPGVVAHWYEDEDGWPEATLYRAGLDDSPAGN